MATLSEGCEVQQARRLRGLVVDVGDRENHTRSNHRMWLVVFRSAPLAPDASSVFRKDRAQVASPEQNEHKSV